MSSEKQHLSIRAKCLILIASLFLICLLILPLVYIFYTAFREGIASFLSSITEDNAVKAILLTLKITLITVCINTIFGVFAAWLLTKFDFWGKKLITSLIDLPLSISPVIVGLILVLTYGRNSALYPYLQECGLSIIFAEPGIMLATIFVTFPLISREIIPVLQTLGNSEEEAAILMGANGWQVFWKITFPHIRSSLLYGIVLCSARAIGEFGAVSVISGHLIGKTTTVPLYIEVLYQGYDYTGAFALSTILVGLALVILWLRKRIESRKPSGKE